MNDVVILSGVRTAIGDFGGSLKDVAPWELGRIVIAEAIKRAGIEPGHVEHVVLGQVIQSEPSDAYVSRIAAIAAGIPDRTPALTLNRLCGSSVQAIISAAQMIALAECDIAVAGGVESMSQSPHVLKGLRWGRRMGDEMMIDAMNATLSDPFGAGHMGVTAENVAERHGITRAEQDALAAESHRRAARAQQEDRFREQIVSVEVKGRSGTFMFEADEHVRTDVSSEGLGALTPIFRKDGGTVTAGNASGINDAGAALVLASAAAAERHGLTPRARVVSWGHAGVAPEVMGLGPVEAVPIALKRAGLSLDDIDVIEANEAFAAQACAVAKLLDFPPEKVNPNGSGIGLGHPVGATGAIITIKALYELERIGGRYGLVTMCIGGGQGIALVIERLPSQDA
ncbi:MULTISPECIES: beta-ketothiolase BktB [Sphingomonadaceae]|uniref:Acetyl-CoA acetyltransferase n=8 Tax=Sphingomonadaceae TaxID=41297 RepID=A0A0S3F149_9SPHN|nr:MULTISPECIES: beta-ketothiolase BktB [Sphingomonadaceae]ARR56433.1 acetyl-CoA acetyltransferase [Rhizorhabdus wittichii DC-6]ALR21409.1 acetyl-CoA acetyltransferase [Sphingobium baderi]AMG73001.1 Acetyl-CoA acyltransferase [Sphingopyxis granuli]AMK18106.1 acetyl-CoA acetyltransferase [Sphingobium sp. MI1205]KEQ55589.1 Acetyl-CoA acetyltransferase [Sphingobium chlorophenolicum]